MDDRGHQVGQARLRLAEGQGLDEGGWHDRSVAKLTY
jgi:hypothetical protein